MLKPAYDRHGVTLYQGDCLEILPQLCEEFGANLADEIVTDPPYGIGYVSNHRTVKDLLGQPIANDENLDIVAAAMPFLKYLLKDNSAAYFFAHPNMIGENRKIFDAHLTYKNTIVWDKGDAGTFGDLKAGYSLNWEAVLYYNKGRRELNGLRPRTILRDEHPDERFLVDIPNKELVEIIALLAYLLPDEQLGALEGIPQDIIMKALRKHPKAQIRLDWSSRNDPVHPTVKPVSVLMKLIKNSTNEGDLVIDPFMGSGTTAAAARATGRRFIGIELQPAFMNVAISRVVAQKTLV
jgi:site-specific DNA-methyltransferase (adenine-specific)